MIHLLALAGILSISFSAIFVRLASVSPVTATLYRAVYAIPVLVACRALSRAPDRRPRRDRVLAVASGLLLAADLDLWHESIALIGAGLGAVIANTQVVFVALAAWFLYGERPTARTWLVVVVVLGGVALTSGLSRHDAYGASPAAGAVLGLLAGVCYAGFLLVFRAANRRQAPAAAPLLDSTIGTAIGGLASAVFDPAFSIVPVWPAHAWLGLLAIFSQVIGWMLIAAVLATLPAVETSVLLLGQPVLTVLWGMLMFGERLSAIQWIGAGVVLSGVLFMTTQRRLEVRSNATV